MSSMLVCNEALNRDLETTKRYVRPIIHLSIAGWVMYLKSQASRAELHKTIYGAAARGIHDYGADDDALY